MYLCFHIDAIHRDTYANRANMSHDLKTSALKLELSYIVIHFKPRERPPALRYVFLSEWSISMSATVWDHWVDKAAQCTHSFFVYLFWCVLFLFCLFPFCFFSHYVKSLVYIRADDVGWADTDWHHDIFSQLLECKLIQPAEELFPIDKSQNWNRKWLEWSGVWPRCVHSMMAQWIANLMVIGCLACSARQTKPHILYLHPTYFGIGRCGVLGDEWCVGSAGGRTIWKIQLLRTGCTASRNAPTSETTFFELYGSSRHPYSNKSEACYLPCYTSHSHSHSLKAGPLVPSTYAKIHTPYGSAPPQQKSNSIAVSYHVVC